MFALPRDSKQKDREKRSHPKNNIVLNIIECFLTLTERDAVDLRPLGVRQVPVHLLNDFLFHL